ncbi:hypothetical protein G6F46_014826 [Rhizopus delemar]|nr:hypothetical protein G6F46_014826 [Rhizopus delemar]
MLAPSSENRITDAARKITRSRAGNALPSGRNSGRVSTPARVIAPRTPATEVATTMRQFGASPRSRPRRRARSRFQRSDSHTHSRRSVISARLITTTYTSSHHALWWPLSFMVVVARSTMPGSCSPSSTNMMPLKLNCRMFQTPARCTRMLPETRPVSST